MATWGSSEITTVENAEELDIASFQADGALGKSTTIWVVRVGDDLYIRPVNGHKSEWYRGTQIRHEGHIDAGGLSKDVAFVNVDIADPVNEQIDAAYHTKYHQYPQYVPPVLTPQSRAATLKLVPRPAGA